MNELDLAYYAGLFDGEGCIQIAHHKPQRGKRTEQHTLRCAVEMVDEECVKSFLVFGGSVCQKERAILNPKWQDQWTWSVSSNQTLAFLERLLPFLRLKRRQAKLAIEFQRFRSTKYNEMGQRTKIPREELERRDWYWQKLKELKRTKNLNNMLVSTDWGHVD